jgi:hypothetical protein
MMIQQQRRQKYLLYCWEEARGSSRAKVWRFSLENVYTHEQQDFSNLREMVIALTAELAEASQERDRPAMRPQGMLA